MAIATFFLISNAFALNESTQTFTLDGQLYLAGTTTALVDSSVRMTVQILNPTGTCLLYEEEQTISTATTGGHFTVYVGSATGSTKRTVNDPGRTMASIFQNSVPIAANNVPGQTCAGSSYMPAPGAVRYFRITVMPSTTNIANVLSPDIVLDSVPQALVAQSLQGLERSQVLQMNNSGSTVLTQANLEALFTTPAYANLQAILAGNFIKTDSSGASLPTYGSDPAGLSNGDIWFDSTTGEVKYKNASGVQVVGASGGGGGISSLTVGSSMSINGTVAGTISSSGTIDLSNTGVAAGTYSKVTVDTKGRVTAGTVSLSESDIPNLTTAGKVSGNTITSGTISGSAGVNSSGNIVTTGTVSGLTVQATNLRVYNGANYIQFVAPTLAGIVNFTLPDNDGNPGDVLTSNGSGVLSWATGTTTLAGDVSGPSGTTSVDKIKGKAVTAATVSGQMMIYDGTAWNNAVMSGDATLSYTGMLSLNKVPVSKGGTNVTSFGNNRMIASNGTGTALQDFTCSLNNVITFDASGNAACASVASLSGAIVNGGNTTGADISLGTNDNKALAFKVNNATAMTISQNGLVGIGQANPLMSLSVQAKSNGDGLRLDGTSFCAGGACDNVGIVIANNGAGGASWSMNSSGNSSSYGAGKLVFTEGGIQNGAPRLVLISGGNIGIGTSTPSTALDVSGALNLGGIAAPAVSAASEGRIYYDRSANKFKVSENGGGYANLTGGVTGSGTTNAIPKFTGAGAIGDSAITDNGTVITTTRAVASVTNPIATGATVNLATSNTHTLASVAGTAISISNQQDGGLYNIVVEDTTSRTYTFTGCTNSYFKPANAPTTVNTRTIYGLMTVKKGANWDCYITWSSGFQ